jgi:glycosyltransferase involved in cell wall biosynthesis
MRILILFSGQLGASRGTPSRARNMALGLAAVPGIEVLALSGDETLEAPGISHRSLKTTTINQAVAEFKPNLVYGHTHKALPAVACLAGVLRVVDLHGNPVAEKLEEHWRPLPRRVRAAVKLAVGNRRLLRRVDAFTTASRVLAEQVSRWDKPTRVIWGGVDPDVFYPTPADSARELTIGYAGNFRPYQGLPTLIRAARSLVESGVDVRLILVGDPGGTGVDRQALDSLPGRVQLTGQLPYAEVAGALASANVLVIPRPDSRTARAGFPSKLPEYMAMGKALVVTDVGDQARVVRHDDTGLVVPPDQPTALASTLSRLQDPALRERLGRAARIEAETRLSWSRTVADLLDFFRGLQQAQTSDHG